MIFWTWAKGLEDECNGSNRRNLRQFISTKVQHFEKPTRAPSPSLRFCDAMKDEAGVSEANVATLDDRFKDEVSLFLHRATSLDPRITTGIKIQEKNQETEEKLVLVRLPTCAIFHKMWIGNGAPHTFYGLLRQWPRVPRIVVRVPLSPLRVHR
jgi:KUP system potassium uptake protein